MTLQLSYTSLNGADLVLCLHYSSYVLVHRMNLLILSRWLHISISSKKLDGWREI